MKLRSEGASLNNCKQNLPKSVFLKVERERREFTWFDSFLNLQPVTTLKANIIMNALKIFCKAPT